MAIPKTKMCPLRLASAAKRDVRTQFGALCYRVRQDKVQVLLITSRGTGRWILPKGWPMDATTPAGTAMQEAWEEAGVEGRTMGNSLGIYSYVKIDEGTRLPCVVAVFPIRVKRLRDDYPESGQRRRKWGSKKKAAALLDEPELRQIVRNFDPAMLPR